MSGRLAWSVADRAPALREAARAGVDVLVIGGGITGAGVLRDAASRGLRALLVERSDFASGTSSYSSKMVHGGLRYLAQGQFGTTRESVRERDLLMRQLPNLVRPVPFLLPAFEGGKLPLWMVRAALGTYSAMAGFRKSSRFRMLSRQAIADYAPSLRREGLRGAGVYTDGQVDDARLVIETLKSARHLGAEAANHAELVALEHDGKGRIRGALVRDRLSGEDHRIAASVTVNAAGPGVEGVRGIDRPETKQKLRPAKGVHVVIPRERIPLEGVVSFEGSDGRNVFAAPYDDVILLGTTDSFTDQVRDPVVTIDEVHYLLSAGNDAFPGLALTTNDVRCVFAGVRPLVASDDDESPESSVSRDDHVEVEDSGLITVSGGKLTTYRAMGERVVDLAVRGLPAERRAEADRSRTAELPLREDDFPLEEFQAALAARTSIPEPALSNLVRSHGLAAEAILDGASEAEARTIGESRFLYAELRHGLEYECAASLCDLLQRRVRVAIFSIGQGLAQLDELSRVAAEVAGWDEARTREETRRYIEVVRHRYQIQAPERRDSAAAA